MKNKNENISENQTFEKLYEVSVRKQIRYFNNRQFRPFEKALVDRQSAQTRRRSPTPTRRRVYTWEL